VDDQPQNLLALEAVLEGLGQNLVKARSGAEALRCLLDTDFALILMDVQMPDMDGLETAALIRQRDRTRHTPIIFLTAYEGNEGEMVRGYALNAVDYLFKPIVPEVLRSKVGVFVELFRKTEEVKRQAQLLWENERRNHERTLEEERQRWEMRHLREQAELEKKNSAELSAKAAELARLNAEIREADRRKDEFLAMLGHELRNPLAPMLYALHILGLGADNPTAVNEARSVLERQVRHMARLVDDLLDVSRISRGKIELRKARVELGAVITRAVEAVRPLLGSRNHRLEVTPPDGPVWLDGDATRLEQVVVNLLTNAAKYTPPGGEVRLSAGREDGEVVLRVTDNGSGIPADMLEKIFELFTQVDRTLSSESQWGMGIGLALVRRLVELHGGTVRAFSEGAGRGSEFVVRLPAAAADPRPPAANGVGQPAAGPEGQLAGGLRVLVVDDNEDAAESLAAMLRRQGFDAHQAHDGPAALEAAAAQKPDVVLLDLGLPGMDGYQVAARLRDRPELKGTRLVAVTGYGQEQDRSRSLAEGFDDHLVKPVEPQTLLRVLAGDAARAG
jgi:signal transduction histidine kinase